MNLLLYPVYADKIFPKTSAPARDIQAAAKQTVEEQVMPIASAAVVPNI